MILTDDYPVTEAMVCARIAEWLEIDPARVTPSASFVTDLDADSLDRVELAMHFEEEFSVEIRDADLEAIQTVADLARYIHAPRV